MVKRRRSEAHLSKDSKVEVCSNEEGYRGAWFPAKILDPQPSDSSTNKKMKKALVQYETLAWHGAARYIHGTLKNSSMTISNMIGPVEKMALDNQPVGGLYFMVVGPPQCLTVTALSYMGKLRVAFGAEKGFIDSHKLKASMQNAFGVILEASNQIPPAKAA